MKYKTESGFATLGGWSVGQEVEREMFTEAFAPFVLKGRVILLEKVTNSMSPADVDDPAFVRVFLSNNGYFVERI